MTTLSITGFHRLKLNLKGLKAMFTNDSHNLNHPLCSAESLECLQSFLFFNILLPAWSLEKNSVVYHRSADFRKEKENKLFGSQSTFTTGSRYRFTCHRLPVLNYSQKAPYISVVK